MILIWHQTSFEIPYFPGNMILIAFEDFRQSKHLQQKHVLKCVIMVIGVKHCFQSFLVMGATPGKILNPVTLF